MSCTACMAGVVFRLRLRLNGAVFSCFPLLCSAMDPPSFCAHNGSLFVNNSWAVKQEWWTSYDASRKLTRFKAKDGYPYAIQTLCIPHTSCDVERSFSMWKNVRSEKQYNMQHALHKAYVSFGFNGVVDAS